MPSINYNITEMIMEARPLSHVTKMARTVADGIAQELPSIIETELPRVSRNEAPDASEVRVARRSE